MQRLKTAITTTLTVLLVTAAAAGAASTGTGPDVAASVTGQENGTETDDEPPTPRDDYDANVTADQVEAALGPFLDQLDVSERQRQAALDRAEQMRAEGAPPARIIDATFHALRVQGVPGTEIRRNAWRLRLGLLLAQFDLTADQRAAAVDAVEARRANHADTQSVRRAAVQKLTDFGIDRAEIRRAWRNVRHVELHVRMHRLDHRHERFHDRDTDDHPDGFPTWAHRVQHRYDLTDEQIGEIVREAGAMRDEGADRETVVEMVHRKLHEFDASHRHGGRFDPHHSPTETGGEQNRTATGG